MLEALPGELVRYVAWPAQTVGLFHPGGHTPIAVPAKLRPFIVISTAEEIELTRSALVTPTSRWDPAEYTSAAQAARISGNRVAHLHWLPGSRRFRQIDACTVDFRWTYRLTDELLARAQRRAAAGHPHGPIARLRAQDMADLLERFRAYLS